jgi:hypothetical protein
MAAHQMERVMRTWNTRREAEDDFTADEAEQRRYARIVAQRRLMERLEKRMQVEKTLREAFPQGGR